MGSTPEDVESAKPHLAGFIVRERSRRASNFRAEGELDEYLRHWGIVGMEGIDTRALVRRLRIRGAMKGVLSTTDLDDASLVAKAVASPGLVGRDLVREVVPDRPTQWNEPLSPWTRLVPGKGLAVGDAGPEVRLQPPAPIPIPIPNPHVVALDYGMKWNIARHLFDMGCRVTMLAGTATADEVLALKPDGVFLSNGPGDPEPIHYAQETIRGLLGKKPIFGICLGHQLLALACGAKTFKLKFGHRGANQPVLNHDTGRVEITCQNHGFAVAPEGLPDELEVTHVNLNDNTIEGIRHRKAPGLQRPVPSRGLGRPARQQLPVRTVPQDVGVGFMPRTAIFFGVLLMALGLGDYYGATEATWTVVIPAVLGLVILCLGVAALLKRSWHRSAMHAAVIVGLVGFVATMHALYDFGKVILQNPPLLAKSTMALLCGLFVILSVKSFLTARLGRPTPPPDQPPEVGKDQK